MAEDTRIRYLQLLARVWGQAYLFHPAVLRGDVIPAWEQVLLAAIPAVEQANTVAELATCLNEILFKPLHDSLSETWLSQPGNWPWQRELTTEGGIGGKRCVHEGWNEHGRPYIYGRRWATAEELEDWKTGGVEETKTRRHESFNNPPTPSTFQPSNLPTFQPSRPSNPPTLQPSQLLNLSTLQPPQPSNLPTFQPSNPPTLQLSNPPTFYPLTREERLLGLFKTWTILKYFFPLPASVQVNAAEFLATWIPLIEAAESLEAFYRQLNKLADTLHDGHALAWHPILAAPEEAAIESSTPALKVDPFPWPEAVKHLRKFEGNIAYMTPFSMPNTQTLLEAFEVIQSAAGLILDLRGYPQTHFQQALVRCMCREKVVSPRYELPVVFHPNLSRRQWRLVQYTIEPDPTRPVFDKPVVALIYGETQSSAEDFGMYLKNAGRAVFVGARTPGHAGNAATIDLPGGGWFSFTGMRVSWPDGRPFQGVGLHPEVEVKASLDQERDEILEKGLEVLQTLLGRRHE